MPDIAHLSVSDLRGGGNLAGYRIHQALQEAGAQSTMYVAEKLSNDDTVHEVPLESLWKRRFRKLSRRLFSREPEGLTGIFDTDAPPYFDIDYIKASLSPRTSAIIVHWTSSFATTQSLASLRIRQELPFIFWGMDYAPGTGGCHYPEDCRGYTNDCSDCPILSNGTKWIAHRNHQRKCEFWSKSNCAFVSGGDEGEAFFRSSTITSKGRFARIGLPISPPDSLGDRTECRKALELPTDKFLMMCAGFPFHVRRKGGRELVQGLLNYASRTARKNQIHLLIVGSPAKEFLDALPFRYTSLGHVSVDELWTAYHAADVFLSASLDDAGPMMISESMLVGTPVVSFPTGMATDLIENGVTGFLAAEKTPDSLANALCELDGITDLAPFRMMAQRRATSIHAPSKVAQALLKLIDSMQTRPN